MGIKRPAIPFISGVKGTFTEILSAEYFWDVIRQPVLFQKTIAELERNPGNIYIDLGPFGTLANFVKQNVAKDSISQYYSIMTPFHQDLKNLEKIINLSVFA